MTGMNVLLIAAGDLAQAEPFLALARGLGEAGHNATVAAPSRFAALAGDVGVVFAGLDDSAFTICQELGRAGVGGTRSPYLTEPDLRRWLDGLTALTDVSADAVVFTRDAVGASSVADRLGVPAIPAQVVPTAPATAAFAALNAPLWTPRALHRWTWSNADAAPQPWRSVLARWRIKHLGLRAEDTRGDPVADPAVVDHDDVAGAGVADQQSFMDVPCLADRIGGVVGGCGRGGRGDGQAGGQRGEQESV